MVAPLSSFPEKQRLEIERLAAAPEPPPRWHYFGSPGDARPVAAIMSRAYYEWWLRRGVDVLLHPEREPITAKVRAIVLARDGLVCRLCGAEVDSSDVHLDHILPSSRGGQSVPGNLQVTHSRCNIAKGNKVD